MELQDVHVPLLPLKSSAARSPVLELDARLNSFGRPTTPSHTPCAPALSCCVRPCAHQVIWPSSTWALMPPQVTCPLTCPGARHEAVQLVAYTPQRLHARLEYRLRHLRVPQLRSVIVQRGPALVKQQRRHLGRHSGSIVMLIQLVLTSSGPLHPCGALHTAEWPTHDNEPMNGRPET